MAVFDSNRTLLTRWCRVTWMSLLVMIGFLGYQREATTDLSVSGAQSATSANSFLGSKGGDEREVAGIKLCWCPPGKFIMGSAQSEPERRPGEDQVEVTLTKGFRM